ncbi:MULTISPECIES: DUF6409 family protein [unclassified Streptomyces]|uniref:DUF6409 family protein n=1 Tax=unclassified Streptomyces TaxID=2593676 RepID=UPI002E2DB9EB|nr:MULTISPECIES: DUF6409 family protein [unclassified Streptomyces]
MATATTTTQTALTPGTIVRCPRYVNGENTGLRRAVVLGLWNEDNPKSGYRVYFYTLGPASFSPRTVGLAFEREMKVLGTLEVLSERTLIGIYRGLGEFPGSTQVRIRAGSRAHRLRTARRAR